MIDLKQAFHELSLNRKIYFDKMMDDTELNLMEIEILIFLHEFPNNNTFTEIMTSKGYAKSYISKAISNLVETGYILKQNVENNKKIQKLFLLERSNEIVDSYNKCVTQFRTDAFANISKDELETFENVTIKILKNLEKD